MASGERARAGGRAQTACGPTTPDARTRSIWLTQLVLAVGVICTSLLLLAIRPEVFARANYSLGALAIVVLTLVTLAVPWARVPQLGVLAIPFADAVIIGVMASGTELRLGFLWGFPVIWVAMHFRGYMLAGLLAVIGAIMAIDAWMYPEAGNIPRLIVVLISLMFIGLTAHLALRRTRALRRLLHRQADRLTATLARRSRQERHTVEILNGIDTGIARFSLDGRLLTVNDAYTRLYGLDPDDPMLPARAVEYTELRGMPVPLRERPFVRAMRGETFTDVSVWLFTAEGEWRALSITSKRLGATDDEDGGILLLVHDVTAITEAQRQREQLTAMASHELKHPLTVMIGNAELALDTDELQPRTRERFESIIRAADRVLAMTDSMLSLSRKGVTGRDDVDDIDLRQILIESVASFRAKAAAHKVTLDLRIDEVLPVVADGFRLRQVIDNLVSNAIKYTPGEGRVAVTGSVTGDAVSVTVRDTGIGIGEADLPNIMTPYFRTAEAKDTASGTGLGLGISHEIVAAHGGTLTIESEPGVGTTVALRLPADGQAGAPDDRERVTDAASAAHPERHRAGSDESKEKAWTSHS